MSVPVLAKSKPKNKCVSIVQSFGLCFGAFQWKVITYFHLAFEHFKFTHRMSSQLPTKSVSFKSM